MNKSGSGSLSKSPDRANDSAMSKPSSKKKGGEGVSPDRTKPAGEGLKNLKSRSKLKKAKERGTDQDDEDLLSGIPTAGAQPKKKPNVANFSNFDILWFDLSTKVREMFLELN